MDMLARFRIVFEPIWALRPIILRGIIRSILYRIDQELYPVDEAIDVLVETSKRVLELVPVSVSVDAVLENPLAMWVVEWRR